MRIAIPALKIFNRLHWAAKYAFTKAGYRWEVQRTGELELGLWRVGLTARARKAGAKRLVVIPGFGDSPLSWYPVLALTGPLLKRRFDELVVLDFPGFHGFLSGKPCVPSMDLLIQATSDALDSLKPDTVLGHSLGGWLAGQYACAWGVGSRLAKGSYRGPRRFILVGPSGVFGSEAMKAAWRKIFETAMEQGFGPLRERLFAREPRLFPLIASEFLEFPRREDTTQFMRSVRDDHELTTRLGAVKASTWFIWGEKDGLSPPEWLPYWLDGLTGAAERRAVVMKGVGHSPQIEAPAVFAAALAQILSGREPHALGARWWKLLPAGAR
jgi:pimeloyl-ACP methyl ester carboxylesterase